MRHQRMFVPDFPWHIIDREEIAYGTTRGLRVVRVGLVFLIEQAHIERPTADTQEVVWKVIATAKGPEARRSYCEAMDWLVNANKKVTAMVSGGARG